MKLEKGRQNTGYWKLKLFSFYFMDCYILYYPVNSYIPVHTDAVSKGKHYRLNCTIKKPEKGGNFIVEKSIFRTKRFTLFRPDIYKHELTKIESGTRIVLSIGVLL